LWFRQGVKQPPIVDPSVKLGFDADTLRINANTPLALFGWHIEHDNFSTQHPRPGLAHDRSRRPDDEPGFTASGIGQGRQSPVALSHRRLCPLRAGTMKRLPREL
jgi:hypothetical protein